MLLFQRSNTFLNYPAGCSPGFDPTHVAAAGITSTHGLVAVASGATMVDALSGVAGTAHGTNTAKILAPIGPAMGQNAAGSFCTFANKAAVLDLTGTLGLIFHTPSATFGSNVNWMSTTGAAATGIMLRAASSAATTQAELIFAPSGVNLVSAFGTLLAENSFYFLAGSCYSSQIAGNFATLANFVLVNLLTGQVQTSQTNTTKLTTSGVAGNGTYTVGALAGGITGDYAAAMFAPSFLSLSGLLQWGGILWSFWYPTLRIASLVGRAATVLTTQRLLSIMGVGR